MAERFKAHAWKACEVDSLRRFESCSLRHIKINLICFARFKSYRRKYVGILYYHLCCYHLYFFRFFEKKAVENTNIFFSLALSSTFGFLLVCRNYSEAVALDWQYILKHSPTQAVFSLSFRL